ncbi:anthrone oxygenase family protein [Streptomyces sp. NPDC089919]|uniref:anthrone oxygenase family protein n=1 Tax=Streptomyces sp. NPDC089919 TaxID=3155188 RepID=UPI00342F782C
MENKVAFSLALTSALTAGTVGGIFYAFSTGVMKAFSALPPKDGIAAMQSVNVAVINPLFLGAFMGGAALALAAGIYALTHRTDAGSWWLLAGALAYLIGSFIWTMAFHIPRNDALAALDPASPGSVQPWLDYVRVWTAGNHVRTVASLASSACFIMALVARRPSAG